MKNPLLTYAALMATVVPLLTGCVVYRDRPVYVQAPPPPPAEVVVDAPPVPPPQVEVVGVAPAPGYVWVGGSWEWHGRWVWGPGHWGYPPHRGAVWRGGYWAHRGGGRVWVSAGWR